MTDPHETTTPETVRIDDSDLDDLASTLAKTITEVRQHGVILDRLTDEPTTPARPSDEEAGSAPADDIDKSGDSPPTSPFILAMGGEKYATELAALTGWVNYLFLPVYGREISSSRPWCAQWHEHPEAVARLHALWLAWQQFTTTEAGLSGPSTWHRDHLDHALAQLRSPDGPFAACSTSPTRPTHRVLATPAPELAGASR